MGKILFIKIIHQISLKMVKNQLEYSYLENFFK